MSKISFIKLLKAPLKAFLNSNNTSAADDYEIVLDEMEADANELDIVLKKIIDKSKNRIDYDKDLVISSAFSGHDTFDPYVEYDNSNIKKIFNEIITVDVMKLVPEYDSLLTSLINKRIVNELDNLKMYENYSSYKTYYSAININGLKGIYVNSSLGKYLYVNNEYGFHIRKVSNIRMSEILESGLDFLNKFEEKSVLFHSTVGFVLTSRITENACPSETIFKDGYRIEGAMSLIRKGNKEILRGTL